MCKINNNIKYDTNRCEICGIETKILELLDTFDVYMDNTPEPELHLCPSTVKGQRIFLCSNCERTIKEELFKDLFTDCQTIHKAYKGYTFNLFGKKKFNDGFMLDEYLTDLIDEIKPTCIERSYDYRYIAKVHKYVQDILDKLTKNKTVLPTEEALKKAFNEVTQRRLFEISWCHPEYRDDVITFDSSIHISHETDEETIHEVLSGNHPLSIEQMQAKYGIDNTDVGFKVMSIEIEPKLQYQEYPMSYHIVCEVRGKELTETKEKSTKKKKPINPSPSDLGSATGGFKVD